MKRGNLGFEVTSEGDLVDCAANVSLLGRLWLDRSLIDGDDLGEGDPGDFDHGAWHIACHLVAGGGVRRTEDGRLFWLEVSHIATNDEYVATATVKIRGNMQTLPLTSAEGRGLLKNSTLLGFVEGNSLGRTSSRGRCDTPNMFNLWRRQDFDQPIESPLDGGKVWEHWCTTRDIRESNRIGTSVLTSYVSLVAALGDHFPAFVARCRIDYAHPMQLCAMSKAGFVGEQSAMADVTPVPIPADIEKLLYEGCPSVTLQAVEGMDWNEPPCYFMFLRRIDRWCTAKIIHEQFLKFT